MQLSENRWIRVTVALLLPFAACWIQWQLWSVIKPFVWFLFFPTVFFSSRIGGKIVGFVSTAISALLVVYVFIPPQLSFSVANPESLYSVVLFLLMGVLFSQAHENLEKANHQVAAALEDSRIANEKVTHLYEKTLRLDELKTQFFANVSHELRTPLTLILGPVKSILNTNGLDSGFRHELEMVERNARMLYRKVNDLLDVAKLEAGGVTLNYVNTELSSVVRFVASHFENRAAEQEIHFRVEAPEHLYAQVDTDKYRRILLNLLANAFKFTQVGGEIIVTLDVLEGAAVLHVRDNGTGIPVDKREMIFERFSQVDGSTERRYGGTGLGLAIVREFAVLHGGSATVTETPGGGALFTVTLPLLASQGTVVADQDETDAEQFERQLPLDGPQLSGGRTTVVSGSAPLILVVEDNPDMNDYISTLLGRQYRVASAFDGEEGLALAESLNPDLLITDMMMPRMNGERLVQALRCKPEMDALPIIMLSAKADDALRVHLLENGVQDYLIKPFSDAELLARVGAFLAERQRTDEELFRSEEEFRIMFMESSVGMSQVAPDTGHFIRVNPAFCRFVGYAEQELLNMTVMDITHPDERARDRDRIRALNNGEIPNFQEDKRYLRADGAVVYGHVTVNLISDKNGKPLRTLAVTQDITDRVLSEQELKHRNDELERFNRASVGRELEMIRLKQRINNLSVQLGQEPPYNLAFVEKSGSDADHCTP
jgi:PAS domain S-box-containing protein